MYYKPAGQKITDNLQKIGALKNGGRVRSTLVVGNDINSARAFIRGVDSSKFPAYADTVAKQSLADLIELGNLRVVELHDVWIEYCNELGETLYVYEGRVPSGHHLYINPQLDEEEYYVDQSLIVDSIIEEDVNTTIVVPFKNASISTFPVSIVWKNSSGKVLETYSGNLYEGSNINVIPKTIDDLVYDISGVNVMMTVTGPVTLEILVPKWCIIRLTWKDAESLATLDTYENRVSEGYLLEYVPDIDSDLYEVEKIQRVVTSDWIETLYPSDKIITVLVTLTDQTGNVVKSFERSGEVNSTLTIDVEDVDLFDRFLETITIVFNPNYDNTFNAYTLDTTTIVLVCTDENDTIVYSYDVQVDIINERQISIPNISGFERIVDNVAVNYHTENPYRLQCYNKLYTIQVNLTDHLGNLLYYTHVTGILNSVHSVVPPEIDDYETSASSISVTISPGLIQAGVYDVVAYGEVCQVTLVVRDDQNIIIGQYSYSGVYGNSITVVHEDIDGYEKQFETTEIQFDRSVDNTVIDIVVYYRLYTFKLHYAYAYSSLDTTERGLVGVDDDGDGYITSYLQTTVSGRYGSNQTIVIENVDGFDKLFDTYDVVFDSNLIPDRNVSVLNDKTIIAYTRLFYHKYILRDHTTDHNILYESETVPVKYDELVYINIPDIAGYRINRSIVNPYVRITDDDPEVVINLLVTDLYGVYCRDDYSIVFSSMSNTTTDQYITTHCYLWFNRGNASNPSTLTVTCSDGSINKHFNIDGKHGLLDIPISRVTQGLQIDYSNKTLTFTITDNDDPANQFTISHTVASNYVERNYFDTGNNVSNYQLMYIGNDYTVYGVQTFNFVPNSEYSVARVDAYAPDNIPKNMLVLLPEEVESNFVDLVPAINGGAVLIGNCSFDSYFYGVLDMYSTVNNIPVGTYNSYKLIEVGGLKYRIPNNDDKFVLDELVYNSDGTYQSSFDNSLWTSFTTSEGYNIDLNINNPLYVIVLIGCKYILDSENNVTGQTYHVLTGDGSDLDYSNSDLLNNCTILLNNPTSDVEFDDSLAPISVTCSGILTYGNQCSISAGLVLMPNWTEVISERTMIGSLLVSNKTQVGSAQEAVHVAKNNRVHCFEYILDVYYDVTGNVPQVEQVEINVQLIVGD